MTTKTMDISTDCNDLIKAYHGFYEDALQHVTDKDAWVHRQILADSPKQRLKVYCTWEGILGYSNRLYEIATQGIIAL